MNDQLLNDLRECAEYIGEPKRWVQGEAITIIPHDGKQTVAYCSTGVIDASLARQRRIAVIDAVYAELPNHAKCGDGASVHDKRDAIEAYNDSRMHATVMRVWRKAIANQEARLMAAARHAAETELVVAGD